MNLHARGASRELLGATAEWIAGLARRIRGAPTVRVGELVAWALDLAVRAGAKSWCAGQAGAAFRGGRAAGASTM